MSIKDYALELGVSSEITPADIKRFRKIGREINNNFNHSRDAWFMQSYK